MCEESYYVFNIFGDKFCYKNGTKPTENIYHRTDGPALEYADGDKFWYINGKAHREDGPAIEYSNGNKYWYLNGELHRENGPAIERANSNKHWYINGKSYSEKEYWKIIKLKVFI